MIKKIKSEIESFKADMKKNEEEEKQFLAAATKITNEEIFPEKSIKQLNAKVGDVFVVAPALQNVA